MLTKKYNHNLKVETYFIWWECLGLLVRRQHISSSEKTAPRRQEGGVRLYTGLQQREAGSLNIKDYCHVRKIKYIACYVWEDASLWAH